MNSFLYAKIIRDDEREWFNELIRNLYHREILTNSERDLRNNILLKNQLKKEVIKAKMVSQRIK